MTDVKIEGKVGGQASAALEPHARALYDKPGCRVLAIIEMAHTERTQPAPDSEKTASVRMRITALEIPSKEQEPYVRDAMRALHLQRTASGTLDDSGELELSKDTLQHAAGLLTGVEMARLRAGLSLLAGRARRTTGAARDFTVAELLAEFRELSDGLDGLLDRAQLTLEDA